jgi:hypothetical protein
LRKKVKDKLDFESLTHELSRFSSVQKAHFLKITAFLFMLSVLACYFLGMDNRITFHFILLAMVEILPSMGTAIIT